MRTIFIISLLLLICTVSANAGSKYGSKKTTTYSTFYPINQNVTSVFQSSFGETKSVFKFEDHELVTLNESEKFKYRQSITVETNGIFITETYQKIHVFLFINKEAKYTYNKPLLRLPFPLTPGKSWTWSGIEYSDGDSNIVNVSGKIFDMEDITVPAGKFKAIKVETKIESSSNTKNIITEWYAEDLGLVKASVSIEGGGLMGTLRDLFGYGKINFELKEVIHN